MNIYIYMYMVCLYTCVHVYKYMCTNVQIYVQGGVDL